MIFNGGSLGVNTLTLTDNTDTNANIGNGTIAANKLLLSGASTQGDTQGDKNFYLESGTIEIDGEGTGTADAPVDVIASADQDQEHKLFIGAGAGAPASANATQGANLNLQGQVDGHYRVATDVTLLGGNTNGAGTTNGPASLAVNNGNWQLQSVTAEGQNNHLNIGANSTDTKVTGTALNVAPNSTLKVNGGQASFTDVELNGADSALELNNERLTVTGTGNFTQGSLRGTGDLAVSGQNAQANFTSTSLKNYVTQNDAASVILEQGGALNFADQDTVELTEFSFDNSDTGSGDIHVINTTAPAPNNVLSGNDLSLSHELASTDLPVDIHATNLSLGSDSFDSQKQAAHGLGVDTLQAQNVSFNAGPSDAFMLKDQLNLRAPNQADGSTGSGSVSGNVIVAGGADNGFNVQLGNYTTTDKITLAKGELNVGNDTNTSGNASLALSGSGSELRLDNTAGNNTINVAANGDGYSANLDLTGTTISAVKDSSNTYYTSVNVGTAASIPAPAPAPAQTSASVDLKSSDLQALLNDNNIAVNLATSGELNAQSGDLVLDSTDLVNGNNAAATAGQIAFNQGGHLNVAGNVTLQYDGSSANPNVINLGQGAISSHSLALQNTATPTSREFAARNTARANTNPTLTIATGTYNINATQDSGALITGAGQTVGIGDGTTSGSAVLNINGTPTGTEYTIETDLALTSNSNAGNGGNSATVNFSNGNFSAHNVYANGDSNSLNIGTPSDPQAAPTASLTGQDLELGTDSTLNVSGGEATFNNVALGSGSTLNLNNERLTVANGSGDFSQGKLQGTGHLAVVGADANASMQGQNFRDFVSGGAQVTLQEGADLNLQGTEATDLAGFTYDNVADGTGNGQVHVVAASEPAIANSQISGQNLAISQELTSGDDLALDVKADNLTLGSASYDSASDTNGLGLGQLQAQNVNFVAHTDASGNTQDFTLRDQLNLRAPMTSAGTATGTISGNVVLAGGVDNGLHVQEGNYTQSDNLSLASGDLTVGNTTGLSGDASLAVNGNFALNNQAGNNSITVNHNELGGTSRLDLTNANISVTGDSAGTNFTTFNVGTSPIASHPNPNASTAQLDVTAEQLQTLLEGDAAGVLLGQNGEVNAQHGNGSGDLSLDTADLLSGSQAAAGKVVFNNGGVLRVDQLILNGTSNVNIGDGTLDTNTLTVNNTTQGATDAVLEAGNYEVADALSSTNSNIALNQGANLTLDDFELLAQGPSNPSPDTAVDPDSLGGNPGTISSNLVLNSGSTLTVQQGEWTINADQGDLSANGANIIIGAVNAANNAYQVYDAAGSGSDLEAVLTGHNLNLSDSKVQVNTTGHAIFDGINTSNGTGSDITIKGNVTIANEVHLNSGDTITISGNQGSMHFKENAAHNITANADGSTLNVADGTFANVFDLQSGGHLKLDLRDQTFSLEQIKELRKTLLADADASGSVMDPDADGVIHLGGAHIGGIGGGSSTDMTPVEFDQYNPETGEFTPGTMPPIGQPSQPTIQALRMSDEVKAALADIRDFRTDELDDILLYDINTETEGDVVTGNVGALMVNDSGATSPKHAEIGDAGLSHAYAVSGSNGHRQFISDQTTGELLGANVQTGGSLYLENGGYIGDITLEDGNDVDDRTALVVNKRNESKPYGSGDDGITYINSVSGGAHTAFEVHDETKVTSGSVQVAYFESSSNLDVLSGDLTVTDQTLLAANSNLTVSGNTSFTGITTQEANSSITATGNGSFNGDTTLGGTNSYTGDVTATGNSFTMLDGSSLDAASAQVTTNEIALGGTITLVNGGTFNGNTVTLGSQANISTASGDLSFTAASGDFNLGNGAQLAANNGTLSFTATAGNIYQGHNSELSGQNLNISGNSVTLAGNNTFTGSGSISATGTPSDTEPHNGLLYVDGNQHFAQGADFNGYNISLGNTANVTADSGDLTFTTTTGSGSIGLASGSSVNANGGSVVLTADNGTVFQEQGSSLNGTNLNVTGQSVSLAGNNTFTGSGSISATGTPSDTEHNNGLLYVDGDQHFAQGADFNGYNISLGNTANVTAESGDLAFTTTASSGSIGLASGSNVSASGGSVILDATNGTVFQEQGSSLKGTDLMVTGQSVSLAGNNTFTGSGSITATGTPSDTEHNNGLLYVDGTQNFAQGANFSGGNISLGNTANVTAESGDLAFTTTASSGSIGLASGSNVSASGGSVILTADNGTVFQEQGSSLNGTELRVTGQSVSLAGNNTFTGSGSITATDTESGSIYIGGEQNFALGATFNGTNIGLDGKVTLGSGDGIFSGNTVTLGTNANINATAGNLDFTSSSGDLGLASGSQGTASGDINLAATNGNVIQAQGSSLNGTNFTVSGQNVTLAGNNTFTGSGSISAANVTNGTVTLGGNQSFALGAEVTGNTITLAGGNITASSGDINFNGSNVNLQGGTLQGTNINVSGDTIAVDGTNNFSGSTTLSSTQDIKLNSGSVVNASGDLFFAGNVIQDSGNTINAQNVSFDNTAVQSGQGNQGGQGGQGSTPSEPVTSVLAGNNNFEQASFAGNYELLGSNTIDTLNLGTANGGTDYVLQVGTDTGSTAQASLEVNTLHLNGNTLYADPAYGEATTLVAIKNDTGAGAGGTGSTGSTGGTGGTGTTNPTVLDGDLILGKNVAVAWGMDKAALQQEIAAYQTNGSLNYDTTGQGTGVGTILVVNQPMHVADGSHIVLNSDPNTTGATDTAAINQLSDGRVADLALSDQSQLMINLGAVGQSEAQNTPAITFDKTGAVITAESGAKIVLSGEIYDIRNEIDIFADADTESGSTGVELVGSDIQVSTANGLFTTTLLAEENGATQDNVGHVKLKTTEQQIKSHFYHASDPVVDTLVAYKDSNPNADGRSAYLNSALQVAGEDGTAAETAARMAVYGGAVNTALAVNNTTSDAIARRSGIGHGAPGGTFFKSSSPLELWASPVYSRVESDGLAAEGVDYGTEIDLTGLNAGVELKLNADTKLGAMVNWGQGSADGTGIASGVSNDFDYYGLGAYAATKINNFNLVGDVSYSKVSNDISSNNKVDSINTSVDTTNLSLGLTGRLDLDVNGIQVSPHAGVRYQRIEMDDYSVNSRHHGRVVDYKSDQINLLSMPVGVMITNDYITRSGWQLKPAIDFTATFNVGDNDANGVAVWTGSNLSTPVSTEVLDPFTFGVNVGFSVRKGNFSAGTGINYTSSENTSDFGIQANLRYDF